MAGDFDRRRFLIGALASGVTLTQASRVFAATEFWNAKDPSTWTEEEIGIITSKSPWAREAVANMKNAEDPTDNGGVTANPKGGMGRRVPTITITVRWESAQPILDALRAPLPAEFDGHYVVSVTNLPIAPGRRARPGEAAEPDDTLERLQNGTTLEAKGKDPASAGIARRSHIGSILFGFSKDYLHLAPGDRDIVFKIDIKQLTLKTKFDGKDMMYRGKLAV